MVCNGLITYTMPLRARTGLAFALLFTVATDLHFVLTDRELDERYPDRFGHDGRVLLAGLSVYAVLLALVTALSE